MVNKVFRVLCLLRVRRTPCWLAAAVLVHVVAGWSSSVHAALSQIDAREQQARIIEGQLIAPCCFMQTLDNHSSPKADEMKREIRSQLDAGWSPPQIIERFVDRYGERILAAPQARGFNLFAYLVPVGFVSLAVLGSCLWVCVARGNRTERPARSTVNKAYDPALVDRMHSELARFQ